MYFTEGQDSEGERILERRGILEDLEVSRWKLFKDKSIRILKFKGTRKDYKPVYIGSGLFVDKLIKQNMHLGTASTMAEVKMIGVSHAYAPKLRTF